MSFWNKIVNWFHSVTDTKPVAPPVPVVIPSAPSATVIPITPPVTAPAPQKSVIQFPLGTGPMADLYKASNVRSEYIGDVNAQVNKIISMMIPYAKCSLASGKGIIFVALTHSKEADCDPRGCFDNGDLIIGTGKLTHDEPKGCGPYATLEDSARFAFKDVKDPMNVNDLLIQEEKFNGLGYRKHGVNSPYNWAMTTAYTKGHYVSDGNWDPNAVDKSPGVAAILKQMEVRGIIKII